jgi:hypothetical protein
MAIQLSGFGDSKSIASRYLATPFRAQFKIIPISIESVNSPYAQTRLFINVFTICNIYLSFIVSIENRRMHHRTTKIGVVMRNTESFDDVTEPSRHSSDCGRCVVDIWTSQPPKTTFWMET